MNPASNYLLFILEISILFDAICGALLRYFAAIALHEVARGMRHSRQHVGAGLALNLGRPLGLLVLQNKLSERSRGGRGGGAVTNLRVCAAQFVNPLHNPALHNDPTAAEE